MKYTLTCFPLTPGIGHTPTGLPLTSSSSPTIYIPLISNSMFVNATNFASNATTLPTGHPTPYPTLTLSGSLPPDSLTNTLHTSNVTSTINGCTDVTFSRCCRARKTPITHMLKIVPTHALYAMTLTLNNTSYVTALTLL